MTTDNKNSSAKAAGSTPWANNTSVGDFAIEGLQKGLTVTSSSMRQCNLRCELSSSACASFRP